MSTAVWGVQPRRRGGGRLPEAREWLAEEQARGYPAELVRITGRVHPADAKEGLTW